MNDQCDVAAHRHLVTMAGQAEAGDVGAGVGAELKHYIAADVVELNHAGTGGFKKLRRAVAALGGRGYDAGAERLGENEDIAGLGGGVGDDLLGMDQARNRVAELDFRIADRVAADDDGAGLGKAFGPAALDVAEPGELWILLVRVADEI